MPVSSLSGWRMWPTDLVSEWGWGILLAVAEPVPKKTVNNRLQTCLMITFKMVNWIQRSQSLNGVIVTVTMLCEIIFRTSKKCPFLHTDSPLLSLFLLICSGVVIVVVASPGSPLSPSSSQSPLTATAQFSNFLADAADGDPTPRPGEGADAH